MTEYEDPGPLQTAFTNSELITVLDTVRQMTPGTAIVPLPQQTSEIEIVVTATPAAAAHNFASIATILRWGEETARHHLVVRDQTRTTQNVQGAANAAALTWLFNNAELLLTELLEAREKLKALDLIEAAIANCIDCDGGDHECRTCSGTNELPAVEARTMLVVRAEKNHLQRRLNGQNKVPAKAALGTYGLRPKTGQGHAR